MPYPIVPDPPSPVPSISISNANANGQATMANSSPVAIAVDQSPVPIAASGIPATTDGLALANAIATALYILSAGGPPDSTGKPQLAALDRIKSVQGSSKSGASGNITSTLVGDTALVFSSAPKTIMPGQKVGLAVAGGNVVETVIVSKTYTVSSTATSIPLQYPVVNASSTTAYWDSYVAKQGVGNQILPTDIPLVGLTMLDGNNSGMMNLLTSADSDGLGTSSTLLVNAGMMNSNFQIDRQRNNSDGSAQSLINASAVTSTQTSADQTNYNWRGVLVIVNVTTLTGTSPTLTPTIRGKGPAASVYFNLLLASSAINATGTFVYLVYPGAGVASAGVTQVASFPLPRTWDLVMTAGGTITNATYTAEASLIL